MNNKEARQLLAQALEPLRRCSYAALCALVDKPGAPKEVVGPSGVSYQLQLDVV